MSKKVLFKESELIFIIKNGLNEGRVSRDEMDYYDAFFKIFWDWIKKNTPEKFWSYPFGLLLSKFSKPFITDIAPELLRDRYGDDWQISRWDVQQIVNSATESGKYKLPTLYSEKKFTEKYNKIIPTLIEILDLPEYVELNITEDEPNYVKFIINIDYPNMLISDNFKKVDSYKIDKQIREFLSNYVGLDLGNPVYGGTDIQVMSPTLVGVDEWVKDVLNKQIKKHIRTLPSSKNLKSIRYEPQTNGGEMKLIFKDSPGYMTRGTLRNEVRAYLNQIGYGDKINVDI